MKTQRLLVALLIAIFCLFAAVTVLAVGDEWRAVDPAELAMKTSVVEKNADSDKEITS
jgi:hypothetical protein